MNAYCKRVEQWLRCKLDAFSKYSTVYDKRRYHKEIGFECILHNARVSTLDAYKITLTIVALSVTQRALSQPYVSHAQPQSHQLTWIVCLDLNLRRSLSPCSRKSQTQHKWLWTSHYQPRLVRLGWINPKWQREHIINANGALWSKIYGYSLTSI